jgi:ATP-dependent protease HslVU (ClpYQ) peptidase subunit
MTTIATDGKSMAGDGLVTGDNMVFSTSVPKVRRLKSGGLVGVCGSAFNFDPFVEWLDKGGDPPTLTDGFEALVLLPSGKVLSYNEQCRAIHEDLPTACGSGRQLAIGAMEAGAKPKRAVEIAAKRDLGTGGKIRSFTITK